MWLSLSVPSGGVIAYISSGSTSSPESCLSSSPGSGYLSTSPSLPRPALPSRAVGMVVDICPPAKSGSQRSHGAEKAGRSSASTKSSITSKPQRQPVPFFLKRSHLIQSGAFESPTFSLFLQKSTAWCCCAKCAVMWPQASIMAFTPARAAR